MRVLCKQSVNFYAGCVFEKGKTYDVYDINAYKRTIIVEDWSKDSGHFLDVELNVVHVFFAEGSSLTFIYDYKKEIMEKYGSCKFTTTEKFFHDYFLDVDETRDVLINTIFEDTY